MKGDLARAFGVGHYDLDTASVPNDQTIYHVASLTKTMTAAAIGLLVDEGKLEFDTPLKAVLPDFKPRDPALQADNVQDLLSHRTGMSGWNSSWSQGAATPQMPTSALLQTLSVLPSAAPFRDSFCYWNFGYSLLGLIIERLSGQSYGTFVTERIFKPLHMNRSAIPARDFDTENYAKAYQPLEKGGFVECPRPYARDGVVTGSAWGARSCVSDLLKVFNELMKARSAEM
jgi:CubicO group peptidase (beta-lactamase class C family)